VSSQDPPAAPASELTWHRLHPVTPLVRSWTVVAVALVFLGQQSLERFNEAADLTGTVTGLWWKILLGLVALAAVALGYSALAWRMTAYAIDDNSVHMRKGVLFRQQRDARLDRLQAVDIRQPLLARLFGLAELTLEVAGGSGSAIAIGFLKDADARQLRADLLARAAGVRARSAAPAPAARSTAGPADVASAPVAAGASGVVPASARAEPGGAGIDGGRGTDDGAAPDVATLPAEEAPEELLYEVPLALLLRSLVRSPVLWIVAAAIIGVVVAVVLTRQPGILASAFPAVIGGGSYLFNRVAGEFGFRAALSPDGIRLRHGLLETRAQTIPPGRIQAVSLSQGPLWRGPDWWRVQVNVAGYGVDASNGGSRQTVLLPVGSRQEALTALWLVLPDLGAADPLALLDEGLTAMAPAHGDDAAAVGSDDAGAARFTNAPRRARWVDPISWRRNGFAATDRALLLRGGRIVRRLVVVPHERTQSLAVVQGPLQRRMGVATFTVHSTPGPVAPQVQHLDQRDAARLLAEQATRARAARAAAGPERWMEAP
jgi:putative membrane protein